MLDEPAARRTKEHADQHPDGAATIVFHSWYSGSEGDEVLKPLKKLGDYTAQGLAFFNEMTAMHQYGPGIHALGFGYLSKNSWPNTSHAGMQARGMIGAA